MTGRRPIFRTKIRVKVPGDRAATDAVRDKVVKLLQKHDGKDGTGPNPRAHVVGLFGDKAAAKAFRAEARALLMAGG